jgi:hypothetical protein
MKKLLLIGLLLLPFFGCSSSSVDYQRMIVVNEINLWLNLMPGGPPTFHFSGQVGAEIEIADEVELEKVEIYQNKKMIFSEKPFFTRLTKQVPHFNKYLFIFGIKEGLPSQLINSNDSVDLILIFIVQGETISIKINEIIIEKVY